MIDEPKYTERDLEIAKELSGLTKAIFNMDDKVNNILRERDTLWKKMDVHASRLDYHHGLIKWVIGVGIGIQAVWIAFIEFIKR